jgi:capsid protein
VRPDLPLGRYDQPRRRDRVLAGLIAGVLALAALAAGYQAWSRHQAGRLDAELIGYDVRSDWLVHITFQVVTRGHDGECQVRARDRTGTETGSRLVHVTPSGQRVQVVTVDLPTRARAANGELVGCKRL